MVQVNVTGQQAKAGTEKRGFKPIDAGKYNATVFDVKEDVYGKASKNAGDPRYRIQYRITGPKFANRRLFDDVGIFPEWASGSANFRFFQFFKALETPVDFPKDGGAVDLPEPSDFLGDEVTLVVKIEDDDYAYQKALSEFDGKGAEPNKEDFKRNRIAAVLPYEEVDDEDDEFASPGDEDGFNL